MVIIARGVRPTLLCYLSSRADTGKLKITRTERVKRQKPGDFPFNVTNFAQQYADTTGLFVIDISNDAQASYNESRQFISASLYKLFVACAVALGKYVGWQAIDERLQSEGYMNTILNNYDADGALITDKLTTPRNVATLLKRLHEGMLLSDESTERFIALLE